MNILKYTLVGLVLAGSVQSFAQEKKVTKSTEQLAEKKTPKESATEQTNRMAAELDLTAEQKENVAELNLKVANKIQAIEDNESFSDDKKKEFISGNKKDHMNALSTILTEEQMSQWKELNSERKVTKKTYLKTPKKEMK
ncbi:MAG: hypothetical protein JKY09_06855 [Crocinitomicaceae bacterium]|nr:hypothetical protein [Crocinitomicaceae bacterium]